MKKFSQIFKASSADVINNKALYANVFFGLILLSNLETFFSLFGVGEESYLSLFLTSATILGTFILLSKIVLIEKRKHGGVGELLYLVPTFLLYNIYYSFFFFIGIFFLIVPGLYALIYFAMVPLVAVLDDDCKGSYFSESKRLVKKDVKLVAIVTVVNLLIECSSFLLSPIKNPVVKAATVFFYSFPYAFATIVITIATVKIYYYLKAA